MSNEPIEKTQSFIEMLSGIISYIKDLLIYMKNNLLKVSLFVIIACAMILFFPLNKLNINTETIFSKHHEIISLLFIISCAIFLTYLLWGSKSLFKKLKDLISFKYLIFKLKHLPKEEKWILAAHYSLRYSSLRDVDESWHFDYFTRISFNNHANPYLISLFRKKLFTKRDSSLYDLSPIREDIREYLLLTNAKCLDCKNEKEAQEMDEFLFSISNLEDVIKRINERATKKTEGYPWS